METIVRKIVDGPIAKRRTIIKESQEKLLLMEKKRL
nr:MAG TPA: hypothetical protein [Caudoviricetes sp.]